MNRFFKIGELSKLYGISSDSIRYYEKLGLIHPVRGSNEYRLYSVKDVWRMNVICDLRSLGFSMEKIRNYLDNRNIDNTLALLSEEKFTIEQEQLRLKRLEAYFEFRLQALKNAGKQPVEVVERTEFPPRPCHEIWQPFQNDEEMDVLIKQLLNQLHSRLYIIGNTQIGARMDAGEVSKQNYHQYKSVFIIDDTDQTANSLLAGGEYLTLRYHGNTMRGDRYVPMLFEYAAKHGLSLDDEIIEITLIDIHEASDYNEHLTELQARIVP